MAYVRTNWQDYPNTSTPLVAASLNNMEGGISNAYVTGSGLLANVDISAGAAIALSKLASSVGYVASRKTTSKAVTNTVADTDLLNGEFSVAAGALGATGIVRITAWGDWVQNSGGTTTLPRFKVKLGVTPTVVLDTFAPVSTTVCTNSATRFGWRIAVESMNSATGVQWVTFNGSVSYTTGASAGVAFGTGEGAVAASFGVGAYVGSGAGAIDTTAAMNVLLTVINPSATTTETKLMGALMEIL